MTRDRRRARRADEPASPRVERAGAVLRVRAFGPGRQVLRARQQTKQAGFTAEYIPTGHLKHHPILISDGPLHDEQRSKVARFFAPAVVARRYGDLMTRTADRLLDDAARHGQVDLGELALHYSVEVTAQVVGLTEAPVPALAGRLVSFFRQPPLDVTRPGLGRTRRQWMQAAGRGLLPIARMYVRDVRPAIRARRRDPRDDIITHLISEGYTDADILVECVTYGTAGMVTTREFIVMAAWHLLDDPALAEHFLAADTAGRHAVLNEIIRLEPVVGHLYRRACAAFELTHGAETTAVQPDDLLDVCVRHTNTDESTIGEAPFDLCPGRPLPAGVDASVHSFGDGAHRCPGQPLALHETEVLLARLLALRPRLVRAPEVSWDDLIEGYQLRGLLLDLSSSERPLG